MKYFALALLATAVYKVNAAAGYVEGFDGLVSTGTQTTETTSVLLKDFTDSSTIWSIATMSYYDHDTGYEWIRVTHTLNEYIAIDDIVTFSLSFQSSTDDWVDPKNVMIEDVGECKLQLNSADTRFWDQTPNDKYTKCGEQNCMNTLITSDVTLPNSWMSGTFTTTADTQQDWYCPVADDDKNAPFCTEIATTDALYGTTLYMCSAIKCVHQRMKETWDPNDQDFMFDPSTTS